MGDTKKLIAEFEELKQTGYQNLDGAGKKRYSELKKMFPELEGDGENESGEENTPEKPVKTTKVEPTDEDGEEDGEAPEKPVKKGKKVIKEAPETKGERVYELLGDFRHDSILYKKGRKFGKTDELYTLAPKDIYRAV